MTVQECYDAIGGDYDEIMSRLRSEERVKKFAGMFLKEECYNTLVEKLKEQNQEEAFRAAHTLKGCVKKIWTRLIRCWVRLRKIMRRLYKVLKCF